MALAMTRPWKYPKTGVYWLRRRVPHDLVAVVGRHEISRSLETRDPAEAKQKIVQKLAELDARWAGLRRGIPVTTDCEAHVVSDRETHALAQPFYDRWLADHRENPSEQLFWQPRLHKGMWIRVVACEKPSSDGEVGYVSADDLLVKSMRLRCPLANFIESFTMTAIQEIAQTSRKLAIPGRKPKELFVSVCKQHPEGCGVFADAGLSGS